jgi:hypothetical protein
MCFQFLFCKNSNNLIIKKEKFHRAGRGGHGQKSGQRSPKGRAKRLEIQGGARSFSGAFAFVPKALPALKISLLERTCGGPIFLA